MIKLPDRRMGDPDRQCKSINRHYTRLVHILHPSFSAPGRVEKMKRPGRLAQEACRTKNNAGGCAGRTAQYAEPAKYSMRREDSTLTSTLEIAYCRW